MREITSIGRLFVLAAFAAFALLWQGPRQAAATGSVNDLTGPWQLFVDDYPVAAKSGVVRTYHAFQKYAGNPVLVADRPWESTIVYIYGTVLRDESGTGYRMWYHTMRPDDPNDDGSFQLYATSTDGIHWTKPNLGLRSWYGSTANNMYFTRPTKTGITSVIHTPDDPDPARRYKFMSKDNPGYWAAWSPDGIHVTDAPYNPVFSGGSDVGQFTWDPHTQRYLGYVKNNSYVNGLRRRSVALTTTTDINTWPSESIILEPDAVDDRWVPPGTVQCTHLYGLSAFAYEAGYIGFLWIFRATDAEGYYIGPVFAEVVSSRDGVHWTREEGDRPPILPLGPNGAWDDGQLYTARAPVVEGDTIKIWYGACDQVHGTALTKTTCSIGLATLRKDGFASLDAGATSGTILTKTLAGAAGPLRVNYKVSGGWLKVEVLDENSSVIPGYTQSDCVALTGDSVNQVVTWAAHAELPAGLPLLRLRFILQNASVYSFMAGDSAEFVDGPSIVQHPSDQVASYGGTAAFSVQATGSAPLAYRWQKNGADLADGGHYSGAATATLTIANADTSDVASYRCMVANGYGSVTSNAAALMLRTATFGGVGILAGGVGSVVTGASADGLVLCGTSANRAFIWTGAGGMKSLGLPAGATASSAAGVGIYNASVVVAVDTDISTTRAQKWTGNTAGVGSFAALPRVGGTRAWTVQGLGTNGTTDLWIAGSTLNGGDGNGREAVRYQQSSAATSVVPLPSSPSGAHDHSDFYAVSDTGACAGRVQYPGTAPTGGARQAWCYRGGTSTMLNTLFGSPVSTYEAVGRAVSRNGLVDGGWSYYAGGGSLEKPVIWNNSTTPTAIPFLAGGDGDNRGEVLALNNDGTLAGGYSMYSPGGAEEAFIWDAANGTRQLQSVLTTQYGLSLTGWTLQRVTAMSADGSVIAGNGLHNGVAEGWMVAFSTYAAPPPPVIVAHPQPQQVCPGTAAVFTVSATGEGTLSYQWRKDGAALADGGHYAGSTTATLTVSSAGAGDVGQYLCVVGNAGGSTSSNAAALALNAIAPADADADCDVDLADFGVFQSCFNGPNRLPAGNCTADADFDDDGDVDLADFSVFQHCFNGPNRLPTCS